MNLNKFDNSPHVAPLLVKLYDSHKLYALAKQDMPAARTELSHAVVSLFEADINGKEQDLLADILIGLMRRAETELRGVLSEKLATLDNIPLRLVLHLVNDEITVASPMLEKSTVLSDLDIIYIIKSRGAAYWQAIAKRSRLSNEAIDMLVDSGDFGTAVILSQNERIRLTKYALGILGDTAKEHDDIARPLLMRPEIPEDLARKLYRHVGKELQEYISAFFGVNDREAQAVADEIILEFVTPQTVSVFMPTEKMINEATQKVSLKMLGMDDMMETLNKGDIASFIAQFSVYTGLSSKKIHDSLKLSCPKGMAIACRAFRIQKTDFVKIFLQTHRMRSGRRQVDHGSMLDILQYFDRIRPESALRIIRSERS